ncbi:head-proximal tip of tail tube completion + sheath stabilizer protein [Sinorhizobium phage phiN3]|uniref:Head-proximal tip of tail tube completion + sheath stabilizer protein n=1 Tax=Sinorhizobium phage phiN3 TaxID=1647405 RepID=A0A0F6YP39_9CAUD|nr:head-proximal tip of tail tube completion + sheath stabilizer protein [Sinorhizobium phage phiN3]AKF13322.1 head-proximal tip of tail tube completion + sheath stabilizer protein [Sinorhizobium phage phiN3]
MSDNLLQTIDFSFSIKRLAQTNYFVQRVSLPGIEIGEIEQPNRYGGTIFHHGTKLRHDEFSITFKIDENMENWLEIYSWIVGLAAPISAAQHAELKGSTHGLYSDATLVLMSSAKNPLHQFTFTNMFPKSISSIELDVTQTAMTYATATATFQFDHFTHKALKVV